MTRLSYLLIAIGVTLPLHAGSKDSKVIWMESCAKCHGVTGNGRDPSGKQLPDSGADLTDSRRMNRKKDAEWIRIIMDGKDKMPSFKGTLLEAEAQKLVTEVIRPFSAKK